MFISESFQIIPISRKFLLSRIIKKNKQQKNENDIIEAEIIEEKKDEL